MILKLEKVHIDYILKQTIFPTSFRERVFESFCENDKKHASVQVSEEEVRVLRDVVAGLLQEGGFDSEYKTTDAGKVLEELIDLL